MGKDVDSSEATLKPTWALLLAGWTGVVAGLGLALGLSEDHDVRSAPTLGEVGPAACPPCDEAAPRELTPIQLTQRTVTDGAMIGSLAGFQMRPWTSAPDGMELDAAPLVWTFLTTDDGRRLTLVRLKIAKIRAVVLPSAELMQESPEVADAIRLNSTRVLATFDLGQPSAIQVGAHALGRFVEVEPTLSVIAKGYAMVNPRGYRGGRQLAAVQGRLPESGEPFSLLGTDDGGHLMLLHSKGVALKALQALLTRIGIRRAVVFGGVDEDAAGVLYTTPATDDDRRPLAQRMVPGAKPQRAAKLTLGTPQLVVERRP